jgi:putative zinc finger/helix-turn-helix YgiT family protein
MKSSIERPYHFVDSGLPNVYLVGVTYRTCKTCGKQSATIPAVKDLMIKLARTVVEDEAPLTGHEIRFLRKRLGKKSADFGRIIGVGAEQVSRWENDHNKPEESADKLIRVYYCLLSGDRELRTKVEKQIESWLFTLPRVERASSICAKRRNNRRWTTTPLFAAQAC